MFQIIPLLIGAQERDQNAQRFCIFKINDALWKSSLKQTTITNFKKAFSL